MDRKRSDYEIDERAANAQSLLSHPLLEEAMRELHNSALATLIASAIGSQESMQAHASIQAIQSMHAYLHSVVTDKKVNDKSRERRNG